MLVPDINGDHIAKIAKTVKEAGAKIYNIIPLIPQYELADQTAPTCSQIDAARTTASQYIDVFRHCQHCRADAVGSSGQIRIWRSDLSKKTACAGNIFTWIGKDDVDAK